MLKKGTPASPAMALASRVFPVPGGPTNSTPLGMRAPTAVNRSGRFKNSTTCNEMDVGLRTCLEELNYLHQRGAGSKACREGLNHLHYRGFGLEACLEGQAMLFVWLQCWTPDSWTACAGSKAFQKQVEHPTQCSDRPPGWLRIKPLRWNFMVTAAGIAMYVMDAMLP